MYFEFKNVYKISNIIILPPFNQSSHHLKNLQESRLLVLPIARFTECGNVQTSPEKQNYKGGSKAHNDEWCWRNVALQSSSYSKPVEIPTKAMLGWDQLLFFLAKRLLLACMLQGRDWRPASPQEMEGKCIMLMLDQFPRHGWIDQLLQTLLEN